MVEDCQLTEHELSLLSALMMMREEKDNLILQARSAAPVDEVGLHGPALKPISPLSVH